MEMTVQKTVIKKWIFNGVYTVAFATSIIVSSNAAGAVYKCVDSSGKTGYQAKPCNDSDKSDQIELKAFKKPAGVETDALEPEESMSETGAQSDSANREEKRAAKEERRAAVCKKLKKEYARNLRQAKAADAAGKNAGRSNDGASDSSRRRAGSDRAIRDECNKRRYTYCGESSSEILARRQLERDKKAIKDWKKGKKRKKKSKSKSRARNVSGTHNVDRVKSDYKRKRKSLGCKSI